MHQDRSVASAVIYVLTDEFVARRHGSISLEWISDRAAAKVPVLPRSEIVPVVVVLLQRLTVTQAPVFRREGDRLVLTESAISAPSSVTEALQNFRDNLYSPKRRPENESERRPAGQTSESERRPAGQTSESERPPAGPVTAAEQSDALDDFFEGFEKEIMKARLGTEGNRDRD